MTAITRKTSDYNKRLVRAEKKKAGHRQGRIIDLDGFLLFPAEMKKVRKASKLPAHSVESVGEALPGIVEPVKLHNYEYLRDTALLAREIIGLKSPGIARIKVGPMFSTCDKKNRAAHCHCRKTDVHFGRICVSPAVFEMGERSTLYLMFHEVLHFKLGVRHTAKFWAMQESFCPMDIWNAIVMPLNKRARELLRK